MELTMDIDELKQAWQTLDRRLEQNHALQLQVYRDGKLGALRRGLRPLVFGQSLQIVFGAAIALLSGMFWTAQWQDPTMLALGLLMHVYGIATIIFAGTTLGWLSQIDHAAPVLEIQKQLARVRKLYAYGGLAVGLAWWLLWVVVVAMLTKVGTGVNLVTSAPGFFWGSIGIGIAGLLATWWFHAWSQHPSRPRLAAAVEREITGRSLAKARAILDEIARFEHDGP